MKTKITQYEEEIIELSNKLKTYERKDWNKIVKEKKRNENKYKKKRKKLFRNY
jgi:hypothetical protein